MSTRSQRRIHKHALQNSRAEQIAQFWADDAKMDEYLGEGDFEPQVADTAPNGQTVSLHIQMVYEAMTLTALRHIAVQDGLRPNGLRPSKAVKADVIAALLAAEV